MTTALDIDLAELVGEMEAIPCESLGHADQSAHDAGPATHYARVDCPTCSLNIVKAYCETLATYATLGILIECQGCGDLWDSRDGITILGPITGTKP